MYRVHRERHLQRVRSMAVYCFHLGGHRRVYRHFQAGQVPDGHVRLHRDIADSDADKGDRRDISGNEQVHGRRRALQRADSCVRRRSLPRDIDILLHSCLERQATHFVSVL